MEFGIECGSKVVKSVEQEHDLDELMHEMDAESGSDSEDDAPDTPVEGGGGGRDASSGAGGLHTRDGRVLLVPAVPAAGA